MGLLDAITGWAKSAGQQAYQNVIRSGQRGYESSRQAHGGRSPTWPIVTQQTRQAQQARSRVSGGTTGGREVTGVKGVESGVSNPTESMYLYPIYTAAKSLAESYKKNVTDKFSGYVEPRLKGHGAWETVGQAATGLVSSPGLTVEFLGMIPAGAERLARETVRAPSTLPQMAASGLAYQAHGIASGLKENPGRTAGELVGMGLVTHGITRGATRSPVRPAVDVARFPLESHISFGIKTAPSRGKVVGFQPVVGISKTPKGTRPTVGTPSVRIEAALGGERFTPATPLETRIVQKALGGQEAARIGYARNVRKVTQSSGLTLKQATPVIQEVITQHNIPNPKAVSKAIATGLRSEGAQLYGSVVQRGIGQEAGKPGLSRVPRDFDIQVANAQAFQRKIINDINRAAGRQVVAPEGRGGSSSGRPAPNFSTSTTLKPLSLNGSSPRKLHQSISRSGSKERNLSRHEKASRRSLSRSRRPVNSRVQCSSGRPWKPSMFQAQP
jgi:hypothetical protein